MIKLNKIGGIIMAYEMEEIYKKIANDIVKEASKNPVKIAKSIMQKDYIRIHGPEHHFLDGCAFIVAFKKAGGKINLYEALELLSSRTIRMPAGMCGGWGVCGAVTGVGSALSVINKLCEITSGDMYGENMEHTSRAVYEMSKIGGPRCCKRNAYITLTNGARFVKEKYNVQMEVEDIVCEFSHLNTQCIKERCPFFKKEK